MTMVGHAGLPQHSIHNYIHHTLLPCRHVLTTLSTGSIPYHRSFLSFNKFASTIRSNSGSSVAPVCTAQNIERREWMSVREWADLCAKTELRTPGVDDVALEVAEGEVSVVTRRRRVKNKEAVVVKPDEEEVEKSALEKLREESPLMEMEDEDQHRMSSVAPSALTELDDQHEQDEHHDDEDAHDGEEPHDDDQDHDVHEENIEENDEGHPEETSTPSPRKRRKRKSWTTDRKSTRLNSSHSGESRMPSSA